MANSDHKNDSFQSPSLHSMHSRRTAYLQTLSLVLNAALMLYAHLGVSGVIYSNRPLEAVVGNDNSTTTTNSTGSCTDQDRDIWNSLGGAENRSVVSSFCSQRTGCLLDTACNKDCFVENFGYSTSCAECFAVLPMCGFQNGCAFACSQDAQSSECQSCNRPCQAVFQNCTGLETNTVTGAVTRHRRSHRMLVQQDTCQIILNEPTEEMEATIYYEVYQIKFLNALQDAWNGDAKLLAFLVVIFSGIWPYLKNFLLMLAWITPSTATRAAILKWLKRLGKYTLVDMYVSMLFVAKI